MLKIIEALMELGHQEESIIMAGTWGYFPADSDGSHDAIWDYTDGMQDHIRKEIKKKKGKKSKSPDKMYLLGAIQILMESGVFFMDDDIIEDTKILLQEVLEDDEYISGYDHPELFYESMGFMLEHMDEFKNDADALNKKKEEIEKKDKELDELDSKKSTKEGEGIVPKVNADYYDKLEKDLQKAGELTTQVVDYLNDAGINVIEVIPGEVESDPNIELGRGLSIQVGIDGLLSLLLEIDGGMKYLNEPTNDLQELVDAISVERSKGEVESNIKIMAGMFTWRTSDTNKVLVAPFIAEEFDGVENIPYEYDAITEATLLLPSNAKISGEYDGYGRIGGIDIFAAMLADIENIKLDKDNEKEIRDRVWNEERYEEIIALIKLVEDGSLNYDEVEPSPSDISQGWIFDTAKIDASEEWDMTDEVWELLLVELGEETMIDIYGGKCGIMDEIKEYMKNKDITPQQIVDIIVKDYRVSMEAI